MRNEQPRMETMPKRCGSMNYQKKETMPDTKKGLFCISKQLTPGITNPPDTTSTSTGKPDSESKGMGNGNGRVINSRSRHRWRRQLGFGAIFSPQIEIETRREVFGQSGSTGITKQQRAPYHC